MTLDAVNRALNRALAPRAAVVYGASNRRLTSQGARIAREMLDRGYEGRVALVNPRPQDIFDLPTVSSAVESPLAHTLDFALIAVPRGSVAEAVEDCIRVGVSVAMITSAGFAELDDDGEALQRALVARAREGGLRLLGPNCMGLISVHDNFYASQPRVHHPLERGGISVLAQSGSIAVELLDQIGLSGAGIDLWVTMGNCADLGVSDLLRYLSSRDSTRVVACYLESLGDPDELRSALAVVREAGKDVVLLKGGVSQRGLEAAESHTGAIASQETFVDVLIREYGVVRTQSVRETAQAATILSAIGRVSGGVAVVAESGGHGVLAADSCSRFGIKLAELTTSTREELTALVPEIGAVNPIDMTPFAHGVELEREILQILARDPSVDCLVVLDRGDWRSGDDAGAAWRASASENLIAARRLVPVVQDSFMPRECKLALAREGIAVTEDGETIWRALGRIVADEPIVAHPFASRLERNAHSRSPTVLSEKRAVALLAEVGVQLVDREVVAVVDDAVAAARRIGYPVVLKGVVPGVGHKTELGLVLLGIYDDEQVREGFSALHATDGGLEGTLVEVQKQVVDGLIELIVGTVNDRDFGPHIMVGRGGVWAEYEDDQVWARAPVDQPAAMRMLKRLRLGAAVFGGVRGIAADAGSAAEEISRISRLAAEKASDIAEIEVNPLIVTSTGAVAVDYVVRATG